MEHWYEEDEEVFVHARDPFRRIDCLPSSRRVRSWSTARAVADSRRGIFLFEAGLPTRYYLPIADTRLDLLAPSPLQTRCPYKGTAAYYHLTVKGKRHDNLVWYYPEPLAETARIKGLVCFYNEFVDPHPHRRRRAAAAGERRLAGRNERREKARCRSA